MSALQSSRYMLGPNPRSMHFDTTDGACPAGTGSLCRVFVGLNSRWSRWGKTPSDDCVTSEIRILIDTTRRERARVLASQHRHPHDVPSAPPMSEEHTITWIATPAGPRGGSSLEGGGWAPGRNPPFNPTISDPPPSCELREMDTNCSTQREMCAMRSMSTWR